MAELNRRYVVMPLAAEGPFDHADPDGVFVLKPWKDPAALRALATYRENCYPELAADLDVWIGVIEAGPTVRGDVGRRNEPHVKRARTAGRRAGARAKAARPSAKRPASRAGKAARGSSTKARRARATKKRGR